MKHGDSKHMRKFVCLLDAYKSALLEGKLETAAVLENSLQSKYVMLYDLFLEMTERRNAWKQAAEEGLQSLESLLTNTPLPNGKYVHSVICNGDRSYPPGTNGITCSCQIQPKGTPDNRLGVHLSHCNFGEQPGHCKYGEDETCPALTEEWSWFGKAMQDNESIAEILETIKELLAYIRNKYPADWHGDRYLYTCVHHQKLADLLFERSKRAKIK